MSTIILLTISNVFMTLAWYGHLKKSHWPLLVAIGVSWGIALVEYCFAVPANRLGHAQGFSLAELKTIQEIITLAVFAVFAVTIGQEALRWNHGVAAVLLIGAAFFVFNKW